MNATQDFSRSMSQSNPVFGDVVYVSDNRELAEHGYITPMQLVYTRGKDPKTNEFVDFEITTETRLDNFIDNLINIATTHDNKISTDSGGRRRGFLFVTVRGNAFLECIYNSKKFLGWAVENKVGVYMTSSKTDNIDYTGGGRIKKADKPYWEPEIFDISEFGHILNGEVDVTSPYKKLELTPKETKTHINLLINIEQLNTGTDLPGLNGVYISRPIDKDMPIAIQIPGRCCRPDIEDKNIIGNVANCPENNINTPYVKPYGYIYVCVDEFTKEEFDGLHEAFGFYYENYYMHKMILESRPVGTKKDDEPNNSNKSTDTVVQTNKYVAGKVFEETVFNLMDCIYYSKQGDLDTFKNKTLEKFMESGWFERIVDPEGDAAFLRNDYDEYNEVLSDHFSTSFTVIKKGEKFREKLQKIEK